MREKTIAEFDFDGTITTKDTFVEFIKFSKGTLGCYSIFILFSPLLVAMKLKLYPNWKVKQSIFSCFFKGMSLDDFERLCEEFCKKSQYLLRPQAVEAIKRHIDNGDTVTIISASIENWIQPFAKQLNIPVVLCTQLEIDKNTCLTGRFLQKNCYGQEKVNRLLAEFPNRNEYKLLAYGDSCGDKELLLFSDECFYKSFVTILPRA